MCLLQGIGCHLAGSDADIEQVKVRGIDSSGMLCSAFDLGWVDEADGVLVELPAHAALGDECPSTPMEVRQGSHPLSAAAGIAAGTMRSGIDVHLNIYVLSLCRTGSVMLQGPCFSLKVQLAQHVLCILMQSGGTA